MILRFTLPLILTLGACSASGLSKPIPVNISADAPSPTTCLVHITPVNSADAPNITRWDVFVPTRDAIAPDYQPVPFRVRQFSATHDDYIVFWLSPNGTVNGNDGPAREALQGLYGRLDSPKFCPRVGG